jgi:predicted dehydrogenase
VQRISGIRLAGVAASTGLSAQHLAAKHGFGYATTDYRQLLEDPAIGSVIIATRHDSHDRFVVEGLKAGKHIFVEKPLCIDQRGLEAIVAARKTSSQTCLMVGFNRRHSQLGRRLKSSSADRTGPMQILIRVNAGYVPPDSWVHDPASGGGRIIGEVCHFVDFLQYLTGADPLEASAESIGGSLGKYRADDNVSISLRFSDGSLGTILYTALGSKSFSRERVEVYAGESVGVLDDFRSLELTGPAGRIRKRLLNQDLGYAAELETFFTGPEEMNASMFREAVWTTAATLAIVRSLQEHRPMAVRVPRGVE